MTENRVIPTLQSNFTTTGYNVEEIPELIANLAYKLLQNNVKNKESLSLSEHYSNFWQSPIFSIPTTSIEFENYAHSLTQYLVPLIEKWSGHLVDNDGDISIQIFTKGLIIPPHVDTTSHIMPSNTITAIFFVDQDLDSPWIFELYSRRGYAKQFELGRGKIILYEVSEIILV
jgi:hypothetical protein